MVVDSGAGVAPCNASSLDAQVLTDRFKDLTAPEVKRKAKEVSQVLKGEDGIQGALHSFYRQWHVDQVSQSCNR